MQINLIKRILHDLFIEKYPFKSDNIVSLNAEKYQHIKQNRNILRYLIKEGNKVKSLYL